MLSGIIYECVNGAPTTVAVPGGSIAASGATNISATTGPLAETSVPAGAYNVTATAPSGYTFVTCGGNATVTSPSSATVSLVVPSGGSAQAIFYATVIPPVVSQTLSGDIYACVNGAPTSSEVPGGTIAASGNTNISAAANPLPSTSVAAGSYTVNATAPSGYTFVPCGGSATVSSPTTASVSVNVPSGGSAQAIFYVTAVPVPTFKAHVAQSLSAVIYSCQNGTPTTTVVAGGSITASGPRSVQSASSSLGSTSVPAGSYTVTANAPAGYTFVTCASSATVVSPTLARETVRVPRGGTAQAVFYVHFTPTPVLAATTVHTGEPWAGSQPYVLAMIVLGLTLVGLGEVSRRRRRAGITRL